MELKAVPFSGRRGAAHGALGVVQCAARLALWASWHWYVPEDDEAFFRGGVGSAYRSGWGFDANDIDTAYFYDYAAAADTEWAFFHHACALHVDVFVANTTQRAVFAMVDALDLSQVLLRGDVVRVPIFVTSDAILNVDHVLRVGEGGNCTLCHRTHAHWCRDVERDVDGVLGNSATDTATGIIIIINF